MRLSENSPYFEPYTPLQKNPISGEKLQHRYYIFIAIFFSINFLLFIFYIAKIIQARKQRKNDDDMLMSRNDHDSISLNIVSYTGDSL